MIINDNRLGTIRVKALLYEYDSFEIYRTYSNATLLIVCDSLYQKWLSDNLFFAVNPFKKTEIASQQYFYILSDKNFTLNLVKCGNALCNRKDAVTFAFALKQMRKITDVSLYDGIYIEEYGYILPTYTDNCLSDDAVIGTYLSGGRVSHFSDGDIEAVLLNDYVYQEISDITGIERKIVIPSEPHQIEKTDKFVLAGRPELEKFFNEHIINILNEPERYQRLGIDFPSSVILYGPPGCGKTYAVDRLVEYLGLPKFEINSATIASPYIHDTAKKIAGVFESAINSAPSIVVIDEMESYLSNRETPSSNSQHYEEVAEFLRQIQEAQKNKVLIIAMTNMYDKIDPAILRRGRFDHHLEVGLPSVEEITALLINITKNIVLASNVNLSELADKLKGKTLADVAFVVKEAGLISGKNGENEITLNAINSAIDALPKEQTRRKIGFNNE